MIANCPGCQEEYFELMEMLEQYPDLYFAGSGLFERGHLTMILVNDKGEVIIG